jgi:hypothetical protein
MGFFSRLFGEKVKISNDFGDALKNSFSNNADSIVKHTQLEKINLDLKCQDNIYVLSCLIENSSGIEIKRVSCKKDGLLKKDEVIYVTYLDKLKKVNTLSIKVPFEIGVIKDIFQFNDLLTSDVSILEINCNMNVVNQRILELNKIFYSNIPFVEIDPFTSLYNIKWFGVAGIGKGSDLGRYGIVTSSEDGFILMLSFVYLNSRAYLTLNYFTDKLSSQHTRFKIYENDEIYFLFEDKSTIKLSINDKTFKPIDKTEDYIGHKKAIGIHQNNIEITNDVISAFATKDLVAWKLNVKKYKLEIIGNVSGHHRYENLHFMRFALRNLAGDFMKLVNSSIDELNILVQGNKNLNKNNNNTILEKEFDADNRDPMFEEAARLIVMHQQGSTSLIQRKLKLGYNRAGRIIDQLEAAGIVGPFEGSKAREVLISDDYSLEQFLSNMDAKD